MKKYAILLSFLLFAFPLFAQVEPPENFRISIRVGLAWDASISPDIVAHKIYWGNASRVYTNSVQAGPETTYHVEIIGPGSYYFAVTAIDANSIESDFSNEVSMTVLSPATNLVSPDMQGPLIMDLTGTTVRVAWKSNEPAISYIEYTYEGGSFYSLSVSANQVTDHYIRLTELNPNTLYTYEVFCETSEGITLKSSGSFHTR